MCRLTQSWKTGWTWRQESVYCVTSFHVLQVGGRVRNRGGGGADCSLCASLRSLLSYLCIDLTLFHLFSSFQLSFLVPFPALVFPFFSFYSPFCYRAILFSHSFLWFPHLQDFCAGCIEVGSGFSWYSRDSGWNGFRFFFPFSFHSLFGSFGMLIGRTVGW